MAANRAVGKNVPTRGHYTARPRSSWHPGFLRGGSSLKVWQPDSFRSRPNRRSTFNYGWTLLHRWVGTMVSSKSQTQSQPILQALPPSCEFLRTTHGNQPLLLTLLQCYIGELITQRSLVQIQP